MPRMKSLERANSPRRVGIWSIIGLLLIPLVVAGGFLYANWKSDTRLDRVQAAVVNLDEPIKLNGQLVPLGRQLAGGLVNGNDEDENFSWVLTDAEDATSGIESGRYAAVVTIPKPFSALATSYSENDDTAAQATLDVQTSQVSGLADPVVGQAITAAATRALNTQLTEAYLDNIYLGFNKTGKEFATVADAAGKLSDGTTKLAKGINQTADGTGEFADGLGRLDTGAQQLADGSKKSSAGARQLADGLDQLSDGAAKLPAGTRQLANGARQSADGAATLASGAKKLDAGTRQLAAGTPALASGTQQYAAGTKQLSAGATTLSGGLDQYSAGVSQFQQAMAGFGTMSQEALEQAVPCPAELSPDGCPGFYAGLRAGTGIANQALTGDAGLVAGASGLSGGAKELAAGATKSSAAAQQISTAVTGVNGGVQQLATGVHGIAGGNVKLAAGLDQLADGADELADGIPALAGGIKELATGTDGLADGLAQASTGTVAFADGVHQSADGADQLHTGVVKLADGGDQLADGSTKLADGLEKGAKEIPSYNKATREKLSESVSNPVTSPKVESVFSDVATTTLLAVLALWIGGLASYLVLRAVSSRVLASMKSSPRLALESLLPGAVIGAVQAVVLTVMLQALLRVDAGQLVKLGGFALLTALAFVAVNQALVAWFGGVGRFISVILVVLAAAASITSALPELFDTLLPLLPLTPALEGFRSITTDAGGSGGSVGLLVAWLIVGVAASILAVARRRVAAPMTSVVPA